MLLQLFRKTPLAWKQLTKQKTRFLVALAGITFADILMFVQLAFQEALYDSAIKPIRNLQGDLVLINSQFQTLLSVKSFSRERLYQSLAYEGVKSVNPVYIGIGQWRNPKTRLERPILIWGVDPAIKTFIAPEINQNLDHLKILNRILFDRAGRPEYGAIADTFHKTGTVVTEINGQEIAVKGLFILGASFAADGNVISSNSTFLSIFRERQKERIEVGLITLKPEVDIKKVQRQLDAELADDVRVLTVEDFAQVEKAYWESSTPIGFIFGIGAVMGFIVGIVIVYQILYSDVSDHLPEYATLKAMGYSDRYLIATLMQEALLLAVFGYIPGFILSVGLYHLTYIATMLPITMTISRGITVFILTVVMCFVSGLIAINKLQSADPADIF